MNYLSRKLKGHVLQDPITAVALFVTAGSAIKQSQAASDQADAQKKANEAQQRAANAEAQRARIQQVREARIRRAQVIGATATTGMGFGSSGVGGAVGSISSQMGGNIGAINEQQTFAQETSNALQDATDAGLKAQQWQMIGNASQSIFNQQGGFKTIFKGGA